jgi:hypothetical protein
MGLLVQQQVQTLMQLGAQALPMLDGVKLR